MTYLVTAIAVSGVDGAGFQMTELPVTRANALFHPYTAQGKLKAEMTPTTPEMLTGSQQLHFPTKHKKATERAVRSVCTSAHHQRKIRVHYNRVSMLVIGTTLSFSLSQNMKITRLLSYMAAKITQQKAIELTERIPLLEEGMPRPLRR